MRQGKKKKIIILGSNSFIISALLRLIKKDKLFKNFIPISKNKIDLIKKNSIFKLKKIINDGDIIIFAAAQAPVKNFSMLYNNIKIIQNVIESLKSKKKCYLVNIGSDAVYEDSKKPITETSKTNPESLHGLMHLLRENLLSEIGLKSLFVRSTLVFGKNDPHNGYGPNSFVRNAQKKEKVYIFGNGEELRDHIWVEDVGKILFALIKKNKTGIFNLVTGKPISFLTISNKVSKVYKTKIFKKKRLGAMPHNGYRVFSNKKLIKCVDMNFTNVIDWINLKEKMI